MTKKIIKNKEGRGRLFPKAARLEEGMGHWAWDRSSPRAHFIFILRTEIVKIRKYYCWSDGGNQPRCETWLPSPDFANPNSHFSLILIPHAQLASPLSLLCPCRTRRITLSWRPMPELQRHTLSKLVPSARITTSSLKADLARFRSFLLTFTASFHFGGVFFVRVSSEIGDFCKRLFVLRCIWDNNFSKFNDFWSNVFLLYG